MYTCIYALQFLYTVNLILIWIDDIGGWSPIHFHRDLYSHCKDDQNPCSSTLCAEPGAVTRVPCELLLFFNGTVNVNGSVPLF